MTATREILNIGLPCGTYITVGGQQGIQGVGRSSRKVWNGVGEEEKSGRL
jgi:hypothetical protein